MTVTLGLVHRRAARDGVTQMIRVDDAGIRTYGCLIHISLQSADWIF